MDEQTSSILSFVRPSDGEQVLIAAGYDTTSSFGKGAARGAREIIACMERQIELYDRATGLKPGIDWPVGLEDLGESLNGVPGRMVNLVADAIRPVVASGRFPLLLGGDHSVSNGAFAAMAGLFGPKDVTILQIDAHYDLRHDDADFNDKPYGIYSHACVMRRAVDLGFRTVQVGIRGPASEEELGFVSARGLHVFRWDEGDHPTTDAVIRSIPTDLVYLTVDVDGIDPAHMPCTGTPIAGGLDWRYFEDLVRKTFREKRVIGADIVEVAPEIGAHGRLTTFGAATTAYKMLACAKAFPHARSLRANR